MRLRQYINEADVPPAANKVFNDFIKSIKAQCKPYLNLLKNREPLMRGIKRARPYGEQPIRQNRQPQHPRGTKVLHGKHLINGKQVDFAEPYWPTLNKWLESKGHAPRNQSISCSSDFSSANAFGDTYWIFPIGKFKFSWVRSDDFNIEEDNWNPNELHYFLQHWLSEWPDKPHWSEISKFDPEKAIFTNTKFNEAYERKYEFWIQSKKYYYMGCSPKTFNHGMFENIEDMPPIYFAKEMGFYDHAQTRMYSLVGSRFSPQTNTLLRKKA